MTDAVPAKPKARDVNQVIRYTMWSVFAVSSPLGDADRSLLAKEVEALQADLVVLRASPGRRSALFGETVNYVLKHASCRVLVDAPSGRA